MNNFILPNRPKNENAEGGFARIRFKEGVEGRTVEKCLKEKLVDLITAAKGDPVAYLVHEAVIAELIQQNLRPQDRDSFVRVVNYTKGEGVNPSDARVEFEYIDGWDVRALLAKIQYENNPENYMVWLMEIFGQMATALDALTYAGFYNADLACNAMVTRDNAGGIKVKLIDFGFCYYIPSWGPVENWVLQQSHIVDGKLGYSPPTHLEYVSAAMDLIEVRPEEHREKITTLLGYVQNFTYSSWLFRSICTEPYYSGNDKDMADKTQVMFGINFIDFDTFKNSLLIQIDYDEALELYDLFKKQLSYKYSLHQHNARFIKDNISGRGVVRDTQESQSDYCKMTPRQFFTEFSRILGARQSANSEDEAA